MPNVPPRLLSLAIFGVAASFLTIPISARAATTDSDPSFDLRAGVLFSKVHTLIRIDPNAAANASDVVFEKDLGFETGPEILFFEGAWHFSRRWKVSAEFQRLDRKNTATLDRSITIGDTTYPLNANVSGRVRSNLYKVQVGWSAVKTREAELGFSLGAHLTDFLVSVEGQGAVGGSGVLVQREERRDTLAPLPNGGVFGSLKVAKNFKVSAHINYFQLKIDSLKGGLTDAEANVEWKATRNFGMGVGYRYLKYRLDVTRDNFDGAVRYRFRGPTAYVTAAF